MTLPAETGVAGGVGDGGSAPAGGVGCTAGSVATLRAAVGALAAPSAGVADGAALSTGEADTFFGGAIVGFRRPDQVDPLVAASSLELTDKDLDEIEGRSR